MIKNIFSKKILLPLAFILFFLCVFFFVFSITKEKTYGEKTIANCILENSYSFGETLDLDIQQKIVDGDNEYTAKSYMIYPNGDIHQSNSYTLNSYGLYTFVCETEDKSVSLEKTFYVNKDYYSIDSDKASYTYGELNKQYYSTMGEKNGLILTMTEGSTFYFNQPINIYENNINDLITFCIKQDDTTLLKFLTVRLTDCYDSSKYIDITYKKYNYNYENYIIVGANGGRSVGLINPKSKLDTDKLSDSTQQKVGINGTWVPGSYYNKDINSPVYLNVQFSIDTSDKKNIKTYVSTTNDEIKNILVSELNNEKMYDYTFDGFTDGSVYLSITASTLLSVDSVDIDVGNIFNLSGKKLLFSKQYKDETSPLIKVDANDEFDIVLNREFKIPQAKVYDETGINGDINYTVWYNYTSENKTMVAVNNGSFVPSEYGVYSIVYTAKDYFGNVTKKIINLNALKDSNYFDFSCEKFSNIEAGKKIKLDNYTLSSLNNIEEVYAEIQYPNGEIESTNTFIDSFLLNQVGNYKVTYYFSDKYYSDSYSYNFNVINSVLPVFEQEDIYLPNYFIKNATYSVDTIKAYMYKSTGANEVNVNKLISFDGGAYTTFDNKSFIVTGSNSLKIKYVCDGYDGVFIESDIISIVDVNYKGQLLNNKYFVGDFTSTVGGEYCSYFANSNGNLKLDFVNPILLSNFLLDFSANDSFDNIKFVFTDFYNKDNKIVIDFKDERYVCINNGIDEVLSQSWGISKYTVLYLDDSFSFNGDTVNLKTSPDFELCTFSIEFTNVSKNSKFDIYKLCNQVFSNLCVIDYVDPMVKAEFPENVGELNSKITLGDACCADVLSPSSHFGLSLSVSYTDSNRQTSFVQDDNGILLNNITDFTKDYTLTLSKFGTYTIRYTFTDGAGNTSYDEKDIYVLDSVSPEIKLVNYTGKVSVKINEEITPLEYTVSDNISSKDKITVTCIVFDSKGRWIGSLNLEGKSFKLKEAGTYDVYLYCIDEAGNFSSVMYQVEAK